MSQSERIAMDPDIELGRSHHPQYIDQQWEASSSSATTTPSQLKSASFMDIEVPARLEKYLTRIPYLNILTAILKPGIRYSSLKNFYHKDSIGRFHKGPEDDRYLSATDGRLSKLLVQASDDVLEGPSNSTWGRKEMTECTPAMIRIVYWLLGKVIRDIDGQNDRDNPLSGPIDWINVALWWLPCSIVIGVMLFIPADLGGEKRNNGRYENFKYHYWGYSKAPANTREMRTSRNRGNLPAGQTCIAPRIPERPLLPRRLCLLHPPQGDLETVMTVVNPNNSKKTIEYIFISYTGEQFASDDDEEVLHSIAQAAARAAGVKAYWIGCSCLVEDPSDDTPGNKKKKTSQDVYRISDIVRGAKATVVVLGASNTERRAIPQERRAMLQQLGKRFWTFPEILLSRPGQMISLYVRGDDLNFFRTLSKRDLAIEAWGDGFVSRQLIDHYEGSIILSPLELISIALGCLASRDTKDYQHPGDLSYALMGLLRRRPDVHGDDSAFEAFCRLSLANDSNQLIERLICMLPPPESKDWHDIKDSWDSHLWDIEPNCQVVGVGGNVLGTEDSDQLEKEYSADTVILSGAFGAPIRWKSFAPVNLLLRSTLKRSLTRVVLRSSPAWLGVGALLLGTTQSKVGNETEEIVTGLGWMFACLYLTVVLASPYLIFSLYTGKTWSSQPWLFGFEGYRKIDEIEKLIFGINIGRLRWSPYSSDLSSHSDEKGECVGKDPMENEETRKIVESARNSEYGELKVFTLVDTSTMTVTLFRAVRPPVAMLLCGSEGGMQRALLCSYDWAHQTLHRESVLRVDTVILERMSRVDRFRLGLRRPEAKTMSALL